MPRVRNLRLGIFAIAAALILMATAGASVAFAQDAGADPDADWERLAPADDAGGQVLELPQATCTHDGVAVSCDDPNGDDDSETAGAGQPTLDDDTASNDQPAINPDPDDIGTLDDYANSGIYAVPYGMTAGMAVARGPINGSLRQLPPSAYTVPPGASMSAPLTPAARPPLYPGGPWMTPPSMMTMGRPAGRLMAPGPATFRLH